MSKAPQSEMSSDMAQTNSTIWKYGSRIASRTKSPKAITCKAYAKVDMPGSSRRMPRRIITTCIWDIEWRSSLIALTLHSCLGLHLHAGADRVDAAVAVKQVIGVERNDLAG